MAHTSRRGGAQRPTCARASLLRFSQRGHPPLAMRAYRLFVFFAGPLDLPMASIAPIAMTATPPAT